MKLLFYFGHPSQYLFSRKTIQNLIEDKHSVKILIKSKDVLENLLLNDNIPYINILSKERGGSKLAIGLSLLRRIFKILPIVYKYKPDIMIGLDTSVAFVGKVLKIDRISITDDDYEIIKTLADLTYPITQTILCPKVCSVGKWGSKKIGYDGYMKLGYLHPNVFQADKDILKKYNFDSTYAIIRLAKLTAHHDFGIKGISLEILDEIIKKITDKGLKVFISAEGIIPENYQSYLLNINPQDMHHILAFSSMLISDSQSMSGEAAILGVPSIRISSFKGRISVLNELEKKYKLTFSVFPNETSSLLDILDELLNKQDLESLFLERKKQMLSEKIDVSSFLYWFLTNYPSSLKEIKSDELFLDRFKQNSNTI